MRRRSSPDNGELSVTRRNLARSVATEHLDARGVRNLPIPLTSSCRVETRVDRVNDALTSCYRRVDARGLKSPVRFASDENSASESAAESSAVMNKNGLPRNSDSHDSSPRLFIYLTSERVLLKLTCEPQARSSERIIFGRDWRIKDDADSRADTSHRVARGSHHPPSPESGVSVRRSEFSAPAKIKEFAR